MNENSFTQRGRERENQRKRKREREREPCVDKSVGEIGLQLGFTGLPHIQFNTTYASLRV